MTMSESKPKALDALRGTEHGKGVGKARSVSHPESGGAFELDLRKDRRRVSMEQSRASRIGWPAKATELDRASDTQSAHHRGEKDLSVRRYGRP